MKVRIISTIMIVIGAVFFTFSFGLKAYTKAKEKSMVEQFENEIKSANATKTQDSQNKNAINDNIENENGLKKSADIQNGDKIEHSNTENRLVNLNSEGEKIALIEIPAIELKSVIVQGTNMNDLRYYVGHFMNTRMPGEPGNFGIAGHSSNMYTEIFNNAYQLNTGDLIKIRTLDNEFSYYVSDMFTVEPNDTKILEDEGDKKLLTIVTCTDEGDKRLIVRAEMRS